MRLSFTYRSNKKNMSVMDNREPTNENTTINKGLVGLVGVDSIDNTKDNVRLRWSMGIFDPLQNNGGCSSCGK